MVFVQRLIYIIEIIVAVINHTEINTRGTCCKARRTRNSQAWGEGGGLSASPWALWEAGRERQIDLRQPVRDVDPTGKV